MEDASSQNFVGAKPKQRKTFTLAQEDKIIEFYSQNEHLWDPKHPDYKLGVKSLTIQKLVDDLEKKFTASEIHHRFSGMRTTYRSNAIKVGASKTTGADGGQVYVPSWPHYDSMQFLDASKPTRKSVTSFTIFDENDLSLDEEANPPGMEVDSETEANKTQSENQESESSSSSTSRKSGKQSSKLTPTKGKRNNEDVALECLNVLRSINKENDSPIPIATKEPLDRSVVFGEFVTASLTDMSQWNRTLAMGEISNVLVKYDPNNPNKV